MGQDYEVRKAAKKQRKRAHRDAESGRKKQRKRKADGFELAGAAEDELLSPEAAKRKRKKGNAVSLRIQKSLCYKEPQLTDADRAWDGTWEGGDGGGSGLPSTDGFRMSGYDSDVEEQLRQAAAKAPKQQQQRQQQQRQQQQQQQQQRQKPKLSTAIALLDPRQAAKAAKAGPLAPGAAAAAAAQRPAASDQRALDAAVAACPQLAALAGQLGPLLARCMAKLGFREPTPVQAAAWGPAVAGRDVQGVAEPGSGKTLAYLLPALTRTASAEQQQQQQPEGAEDAAGAVCPRGLVLAPSRELAQQVFTQAAALTPVTGVRCGCAFGGAPREAQAAALASRQTRLLVATPGRLLDLVDAGCISLARVQVVVLDEADKMLSVGFEPQLGRLQGMLLTSPGSNSSSNGVASSLDGADAAAAAAAAADGSKASRKKRRKAEVAGAAAPAAAAAAAAGGGRRRPQVLLFTATLPAAVQATCGAWLGAGAARVRCSAGADSISRSITQVVHVCAEHKKPAKLLKHLAAIREASAGMRNPPRLLVFANRIKTVAFVHRTIAEAGYRAALLHGKRPQAERQAAVADFKAGKAQVLVASDVASRGLDIRGLPYVVQYDFPSNLETYIHRVGRTGRLAVEGHAFSFFTRPLARLAPPLVALLRAHEQPIDPNLLALAEAWAQVEAALRAQGKTPEQAAVGAAAAATAAAAGGGGGEADGAGETGGEAEEEEQAEREAPPALPEDLQEGLAGAQPRALSGAKAAAGAGAGSASGRAAAKLAARLAASAAGAAAAAAAAGAAGPASKKARKQQQQPGDALLVPQAAAGAAPPPAAAFVPAKRFAGARPGMAFKLGPRGLGYYADAVQAAKAPRQQQQQPMAAKPKALQQQPMAGKLKQQQQQQQQQAKPRPQLPQLPGLAAKRRRAAAADADWFGSSGSSSSSSSSSDEPDGGGARQRGAGAASGSSGDDDEQEADGSCGGLAARLERGSSGGGRRKALPGRLRKKLAKARGGQAGGGQTGAGARSGGGGQHARGGAKPPGGGSHGARA